MLRKFGFITIALIALCVLVPMPQAQAAHWSVGVAVGPSYPVYPYPAYSYYGPAYAGQYYDPYYEPVVPRYYVAPRYYAPAYVYPRGYYSGGRGYYRNYDRGRDYRGYDRGRGYYRGGRR